ncbi:MAG TPA: alpha/beta hydrolase [Microlunatus sp.]|nr:alpha/beta hydrolase [Microlunatus sp.]
MQRLASKQRLPATRAWSSEPGLRALWSSMVQASPEPRPPSGTAVLVHGLWGNPEDWTWVRRILETAGVTVETPDLPTHRSPQARVQDDVQLVRDVIRTSTPPVVCAGWSFGGDIASVAAAGQPSVTRVVFLASVPSEPGTEPTDAGWIESDPHLSVHEDGTYALDNDWWIEAEAKRLFSGEILEHLLRNPRRRVAMSTATDPPTAASWQTIPTTVLLGRHDDLIPDDLRRSAESKVADVRYLDTDHFILFHQPEVVAQTVLQFLRSRR